MFGLFDYRPRWGLSRRGWIVVFFGSVTFAFTLFFTIHPFLAVTHRIDADLLVVEGWTSTASLRAASADLESARVSRIFTTGGPIKGYLSSEFNTYAHFAYSRLLKLGVAKESLIKVPAQEVERDRTYTAAVALRQWFKEHGTMPQKLNVLTDAVHARRSRLLFQKAFGSDVEIGIISVPPEEYPANRWWKYSAGVKDVIAESAAYLYVRLFFWP